MAVRVSHTNNSSGHDGTYVYRSTSPMDPQNLPAPIADEAPVALGATFEYIETPADGTYYYRTQDHEGGQVSPVSAEQTITLAPDYASAQIGDEIGGGIYSGSITYADARQFHVIVAKAAGEGSGLIWGNYDTTTGSTDPDDGVANQQNILNNFTSDETPEAFYYARDYSGGGLDDWYVPARNELSLVYNNLSTHPEFADNVSSGLYTWTSTETANDQQAFNIRFSDGNDAGAPKTLSRFVRPIRRVAV